MTVALFSWARDGEWIGLLLTLCPSSVDPAHPLYDTGLGVAARDIRVIEIGSVEGELRLCGEPVKPEWKQIYIPHRPPLRIAGRNTKAVFLNRSVHTAFRFPEESILEMEAHGVTLVDQSPIPSPWMGSPGAMLFFAPDRGGGYARFAFVVHLGRCSPTAGAEPGSRREPRIEAQAALGICRTLSP